jgi:cysteinyl-tRNA synthetase
MALQVYSTLTRKKEPFHKKPGEPVSMYVCGPTVYKPSHIGHMVGPVIFDTVKRYLTYLGYKVTWVVNITDVDDKLIKRAAELKTTVPALAEQMTQDYFACLKALNVTGIDHFPRATEYVGGMIEVIQKLEARGYAYQVDDGVYFNVSEDTDYGALSNRDPEQMEAGARLEVNARKRNPGDFALWKGAKPDEPPEVQYESPFKCGRGRPGWHIECTCMAIKMLGETLDIHGGGLDLQFPHHENELAQSESLTGKPFARFWMHNGLLKMGTAKMAGSVGNVVNVADALKHMSGEALRFFILNTHYRSPIEMGDWEKDEQGKHKRPLPGGLLSGKAAFDGFPRFAERVQRIAGTSFADLPAPTTAGDRKFAQPAFAEFYQRFREYMDDDFNTGGAAGVLFELVTRLNKTADVAKLEDPATSNPAAKAEFLEGATLVKEIAQVLGLTFATEAKELGCGDKLVAGLMQIILDVRSVIRAEAKKITAKDDPLKATLFAQATAIREALAELGVRLEDHAGGTTWRVG